MSVKKPQTFANHARLDPLMHFVIFPVLVANVICACIHAFHHRDWGSHWLIVVAIVVMLLALRTRMYSLRVQDRVIRLEERLRLAALVPAGKAETIMKLTEQQLVALRFASDAELPALAEQALAQNLTPAQIKKSIVTWRPDYWRV